VLAEWSDTHSYRLLLIICLQAEGTQDGHYRIFWIVIMRTELVTRPKLLKAR
jgi:hypothetical protein